MAPDIVNVIPRVPYTVREIFADGEARDVDIEPLLDSDVFGPVRDPSGSKSLRRARDAYGRVAGRR
jgi:hypothetical protein